MPALRLTATPRQGSDRAGTRGRRIARRLVVIVCITQSTVAAQSPGRVDRPDTAAAEPAAAIAQAQKPTSPRSDTRATAIDRQSQEAFLRELLAIARHRDWADTSFVQRTLSANLKLDPDLSKHGGRHYDVVSARPIFSAISVGYLIDNAGYRGSQRVLLATRVNQDRLCITPEVVTNVFGEGRADQELERTYKGKLRRITYDFSIGETRRGFLATYERRQEFCVDLFNFVQNERQIYR